MADIKYSVEIAYFSKGRIRNPMEDANKAATKSLKDYDRAVANSIKDMNRQRDKAARLERARRRELDRSNRVGERRGRYAMESVHSIGSGLANSFGSVIDTMGGMLITGLTAAATTAGSLIAKGLVQTLKTGIDFANQMERSQIAFAAMSKMQLGGSWRKNMVESGRVVEAARKDAATLPGEMKDILEVMGIVGTPGMQSGMSLSEIQKMSTNIVAMASIEGNGMTPRIAATQAARILQGRMTGNNNFGLRMGFDQDVMGRKGKMGPRARAAILEQTVREGAAPALEDFKNSWEGLTSTIKDSWADTAKSFSQPLIAALKRAMRSGLEWFGKNEDRIHAFATSLGHNLEYAFQRGRDFIEKWYEPVKTFGTTLYNSIKNAIERISPFLNAMGDKLMAFLQDPGAVDKITDAVRTLAGLKVGTSVLGGGSAAVGAIVPLMAAMGGGAAGGATLGVVAAAAAVGLGLLTVSAYKAFEILTDSSNKHHAAAVKMVEATKANTEAALKSGSAIDKIGDYLGLFLLSQLQGFSYDLKVVGWGFDQLGTALGGLLDVITKGKPLLGPKLTGGPEDPERGYDYPGFPKNINFSETDDASEKRLAKKPPNHTTNIHKVEIQVMSNQDPNRVAKSTAQALLDIARNPKVSRDAVSNQTAR